MLFLYLINSVLGADIIINISQGLSFNPSSVDANIGDTVTWNFQSSHSVTEGLNCISNKGFDSSIQNTGSFKYTVTQDRENSTINYFCKVGSHCSQGMIGKINVKSTTGLPSSVTPPSSNNAQSMKYSTFIMFLIYATL